MDRRNFLRTLTGVAAATALPSEIWPFRKIFLPAQPLIYPSAGLSRAAYPGPLFLARGTGSLWETGPDGLPVLVKQSMFAMMQPKAPLIWPANEEQSAAWQRKFKQYGLD